MSNIWFNLFFPVSGKLVDFFTYRKHKEYKSKYFLVKLKKEIAPKTYNLFAQQAVDMLRYLAKPSSNKTASRQNIPEEFSRTMSATGQECMLQMWKLS